MTFSTLARLLTFLLLSLTTNIAVAQPGGGGGPGGGGPGGGGGATSCNVGSTGPELQAWLVNYAGTTYNGWIVDVTSVHYTADSIFITATGIPNSYADGQTHFDAEDQEWGIQLTRCPEEETGTKTRLPTSKIGVFIDGTPVFAPGDGKSYNDEGHWNQIAYEFEGLDFDATNGHSTAKNIYHHHVDHIGVHTADPTSHSPIVGYAYDGFPIYGPYGFSDPSDATSTIQRIATSYQLRNITDRSTLPDGTAATGPTFSEYALGKYIEDYEYVDGSGDLDEYNGRMCITPEYPGGTYAYFVSIDASGDPQYPYLLAEEYYGVIDGVNSGQSGGHNAPPSNATLYSAVLPVELMSFEARQQGAYVSIAWETTMESELSHFEVQRIANGSVTWRSLGKDAATGSNAITTRYTRTDVAPQPGVNYYRLKIVHADQSVTYSDIQSVILEATDVPEVKVYPNPATSDILRVEYVTDDIRLYSAAGRLMLSHEVTLPWDGHAHSHVTTVLLDDLPAGFYYLVTRDGRGQEVSVPVVRR